MTKLLAAGIVTVCLLDPGYCQKVGPPSPDAISDWDIRRITSVANWELPVPIAATYHLQDWQRAQLWYAYDAEETAVKGAVGKKLSQKDSQRIRGDAALQYRLKAEEFMTADQCQLYELDLDSWMRRTAIVDDFPSVNRIAKIVEQCRTEMRVISDRTDLSAEQKEQLRYELQRKMLEQCLNIFAKGKKHDIIVKAIKQMDDEKEKKDKAAKDKDAKDKDGAGSGGTIGGSGG
jgi:hypothetical protein